MAETVKLNLNQEETPQTPEKPVYSSNEITLGRFIEMICGVGSNGIPNGSAVITYGEVPIVFSEETNQYNIDTENPPQNEEELPIGGAVIDLSLTNNAVSGQEYMVLDLTFPTSERDNFRNSWATVSKFLRAIGAYELGAAMCPVLSVILTPNLLPQQMDKLGLYMLTMSAPIYACLTSNDINSPVNRISLFFDLNACIIDEIDDETKRYIMNLTDSAIKDTQYELQRAAQEEEMLRQRKERETYLASEEKRMAQEQMFSNQESIKVGRAAEKAEEEFEGNEEGSDL